MPDTKKPGDEGFKEIEVISTAFSFSIKKHREIIAAKINKSISKGKFFCLVREIHKEIKKELEFKKYYVFGPKAYHKDNDKPYYIIIWDKELSKEYVEEGEDEEEGTPFAVDAQETLRHRLMGQMQSSPFSNGGIARQQSPGNNSPYNF